MTFRCSMQSLGSLTARGRFVTRSDRLALSNRHHSSAVPARRSRRSSARSIARLKFDLVLHRGPRTGRCSPLPARRPKCLHDSNTQSHDGDAIRARTSSWGGPEVRILHRTEDRMVPVEHARYLARHIRGAKYVELLGTDHFFFT